MAIDGNPAFSCLRRICRIGGEALPGVPPVQSQVPNHHPLRKKAVRWDLTGSKEPEKVPCWRRGVAVAPWRLWSAFSFSRGIGTIRKHCWYLKWRSSSFSVQPNSMENLWGFERMSQECLYLPCFSFSKWFMYHVRNWYPMWGGSA